MVHELPFASVALTICTNEERIKNNYDSDPQPSDSKSDALSIAPHGLILSCHCKYTIYVPKCFRNTVKTVRTMDSNGP